MKRGYVWHLSNGGGGAQVNESFAVTTLLVHVTHCMGGHCQMSEVPHYMGGHGQVGKVPPLHGQVGEVRYPTTWSGG